MSTSRYPQVLFFRHDKYSKIDDFIEINKESLMCSIHITNDIRELNKLYNHNYHLLVTYGDTYNEYDYISAEIPSRFSSRWFHKNNISNIEEFNHNVNYCYITNVIDNREKTRPIFSIFTTCFKSYDYINTAYDSIKKQTLKDWEWVIMDDTPEDEHFTFLRDTLSHDNRIRLYKRDKNSGNIGNVKNEAISLCRGKYVLEMDHDDEILKDCLLDSYNIFQSDPEIGFVYGDTINLFRDGQNCKYTDNTLCKGYGGYYSELIDNEWRFIYNTPNINNVTLSRLICLPNHPRIWNRAVLMELESYSEYLPICDDYEILLRTCCSKYKVVKNNKAQYIQYMNNEGNNFSTIRNSEINRIGPKYISPMFYAKYGVQDKMKELDAYEDPQYITNQSDIWKRGPEYQHKIMNSRINLDYNKQYCIINDAIDNNRLKELYQNSKNDFLVLSNKITTQELWIKLNSLGFGRMKCYGYKGCSDEELIKYFKMMYKNDNCDYEIIQSINTDIISTKQRVFIIHNNKKGGVEKYINDIITLYDNYEYIFVKNKEMLCTNDYSNKDILFIQNLLNCDIKITDIIDVRNKYKFNLFISIHDFIWLCKDQHQYTYDIPSAYLSNNIDVSTDITELLLLADKVIMNSQFTHDVYSKHFDSSNFIVCYPSDYNIQVGIKNIPEIQNKCMNIGVFSPLCKFKGERYVNYLKSKYECDTIQFQIVGQNIPYYKENEFYDFIRKYNINGFLLLNEWGETYGYLLTKIINSGLPLLYNNFGAIKERLSGTREKTEHYFKVYDNEHNDDVNIDYTILESQFNQFVKYINTNAGTVGVMNEDLTIRSRPVYDELFLPIINVYQNREIPKHVFQTSKEILPPYVKELINIYCPDWKYSHFTDKECIQFFIDNPIAEFPNIIQKFHSFTQGQHKADIFRYYYLYLKGGLFLDSDAMFETNIDNIIQNYDSVFAKSYVKNEHLFNGFIATYPRNEIIYDALKHAYYTENHILQMNYHYLCEELLRIVNIEQTKASRQNMVIYQEYADTVDGKGVGRFKNTNEDTVFIHYWQDREIPSNLLIQNDNKMVMIPIGTFCYIARILEKLNYRYTSLPFDFIRSNIPMVNDCINNNFVDFLNKDNYTNNNQGINKYGHDIFLHHDLGNTTVYDSMKRKTKRFINLFDKHNINKVYIAFFQPIGSWGDDTTVHQDGTDIYKIVSDLKQIYKTINNRTENFHVIGIINKPNSKQNNKMIFKEENLLIYELETISAIAGPTFTIESDELYSIKILKQILTTINPNFENTHVVNYENEIEIPSKLVNSNNDNMIKIPTFIQAKNIDNTKYNIPKILIQTYKSNYVHNKIYNNIQSILNLNSDYDYYLITDNIGRELIKTNFDKNILYAFDKLNIGAAKGDFLRYIAIYVYGGVYIDLDSSITTKLTNCIDNNMEHYFVWDSDNNIMNTPIMSKPKNPIILNIIKEVVKRIINNEPNIFLATGPTLVTDVIYADITNKTIYDTKTNVSNKARKDIWLENVNYKNGKIINIGSPEISGILFVMNDYNEKLLYPDNDKYIETYNSPTPNLYKKNNKKQIEYEDLDFFNVDNIYTAINVNGLHNFMKFSYIKRINTTKNSIFYSLIKYNNEIIAFGRRHYGFERVIKKITLNENFDIIEDNNITFKGEDPRCFEYKNKIYILDNHFNDMFLIDYENQKYTKINIPGKNISFINHNNILYFIHYIKPFILYTFDIETGDIRKIEVVNDENNYNYEYRGGTPGYKLNENEYYGFGHRTYEQDGITKHDIFKWIVYFDNNKLPRISHFDIEQPYNSKNICDPTSVIVINDKKYLITAETNERWFCEQDYITNVYEINE